MAAPVNFNPVEGTSRKCQYKRCDSETGPFVAHEGNGLQHPLHLACARDALQDDEKCPVCKRKASLLSLYSEAVLNPEKLAEKNMPEAEDLMSTIKDLIEKLAQMEKELEEDHTQSAELYQSISDLSDQNQDLQQQTQDDASVIGNLTQRAAEAENTLNTALTTQPPTPIQANSFAPVYSSMITAAVLIAAYVLNLV